jgi:hypothetical protein
VLAQGSCQQSWQLAPVGVPVVKRADGFPDPSRPLAELVGEGLKEAGQAEQSGLDQIKRIPFGSVGKVSACVALAFRVNGVTVPAANDDQLGRWGTPGGVVYLQGFGPVLTAYA